MVSRITIAKSLIAAIALVVIALAPMPAFSHGALAMDDDRCKLKIGRYQMHFAGYQPHGAKSQKPFSEFCEDIPASGQVYVVLDLIDRELRAMPISVQVLEDRGPDKDNIAPVVFEVPPESHPTGSLSYRYTFDKPGRFVGLVTAGSGADRMVARFPFSVGRQVGWLTYASYLIVLLLAVGVVIFWALRSHNSVLNKMDARQ